MLKCGDELIRNTENNNPEEVETDADAFLGAVLVHSIAHPGARAIRDFLIERGKNFVQSRKVGGCIESSGPSVQNGH